MKESRVEELIGKLYDMVEDAGRLPMGNCILNREKLYDLLDEIKASIPGELQMAKDLVAKRDHYIESAEADAQKIKSRSEEEAKKLISENEIVVEARRRANDMISSAEKRAQELMAGAVRFCDDHLQRAEEAIDRLSKDMKNTRAKFKEAARNRK